MHWYKWLFRGLVVSVMALVAAGGFVLAVWTSPAAVRTLVREKLGIRFLNVAVQVGSARLRLLGGILVNDLRLARNDHLEQSDFLYIPSAILFHDKEQVLDGKVAIRKVELYSPQFRIVRQRDGRFNLSGILGPTDLNERLPTVVIRDGTFVLETGSPGNPLLEIRRVSLTLVNDPLSLLRIEGSGHSDILGEVRFQASIPRATNAAAIDFTLPAIEIQRELLSRLSSFVPQVGQHLTGLTGRAELSGHIQLSAHEEPPRYDLRFQLQQGRLQHDRLPFALEQLHLTTHLSDGIIRAARLEAHQGATSVQAQATGVRLVRLTQEKIDLEGLLDQLDLRVSHLMVNDDLLRRLPTELQYLRDDFLPSGPMSLSFRYRSAAHSPTRSVCKQWLFEPEGMRGAYCDFPYPLSEVRGRITLDVSQSPSRHIRIDLTGKAGDAPVSMNGTIDGPRETSAIRLDLKGKNVLLDDRMLTALPDRAQKVARQFLPQNSRQLGLAVAPVGWADIDAVLHRQQGQTRVEKYFTIRFRSARVLYDQFPYPFEEVSGLLTLKPDGWECRDFRGRHAGGVFRLAARCYHQPGPAPGILGPERIEIQLQGQNVAMNEDLERALVPLNAPQRQGLVSAYRQLQLVGRLDFSARVEDFPDQPEGLSVHLEVQNASMKPAFFAYALDRVQAEVDYHRGAVTIHRLNAWHGSIPLELKWGLVQQGRDGGFTCWLKGLKVRGLKADSDLLQAMPTGLRRACEAVRLQTPVNLAADLTVLSPPGVARPIEVWWEGAIGLQNATFRAGIEVCEATGQYYSHGYHDGRSLRGVVGQLHLDRASILGQPITNFDGSLRIEADKPDVIHIRQFRADLFGGTLAGKAVIDTTAAIRYSVLLDAVGVQLDVFGQHNLGTGPNKAQLHGPARASLFLTGVGEDLLTLKGEGRVDIPQGKLGQLPILLDLLKAFGLRMPDRTAFEQARLLFAIEGPRVLIRQLDLFGNAVSLHGQGAVDLDGTNLDVDFTATFGRFSQLLPPGIEVIPQAISSQLFKIKMRGALGKEGHLDFNQEWMPAMIDPLRRAVRGE
jgi:hypothetical protein